MLNRMVENFKLMKKKCMCLWEGINYVMCVNKLTTIKSYWGKGGALEKRV